MAGTSGDGIDAACIRVAGEGEAMRVRLVDHLHKPFPASLRRRLLAAMAPAATTTEEIARLHSDLGTAFGEAAREAISNLGRRRPAAIGLSGQTICHLPREPRGRTVTLQLGNASIVAAMTGTPTVFDFRQSDVAAGGQGAPLVPWTDWILFRHPRLARAVQNIGGIGNVTWLPAGGRPGQVVAFDTGPGNMVIDGLVSRITRGRHGMDRGGRRAARGRVLSAVLADWMGHPFLRQYPPRTTGRETFGAPFVAEHWDRLRDASADPNDWLATATAFTAETIAHSYRRFLGVPVVGRSRLTARSGRSAIREFDLILAGGGARNPVLRRMIEDRLPTARVQTIDAFGIPAEAKEALSFAILGVAHLDGAPSNLPQVTGAIRRVPMGICCFNHRNRRGL
jgi:anhydro-N-acetylmuramic acid kinase